MSILGYIRVLKNNLIIGVITTIIVVKQKQFADFKYGVIFKTKQQR